MFETSFEELDGRYNRLSDEEYNRLAIKLGGVEKYGRSTPITLFQILDVNGLANSPFSLLALKFCKLDEHENKKVHMLACSFAMHVLHIFEKEHPGDTRPQIAIETRMKWLNGQATYDRVVTAYDAARRGDWPVSGAHYAARSAVHAAGHCAAYASGVAAIFADKAARLATGDELAEREWQQQQFIKMLNGKWEKGNEPPISGV